MSERPLVSVVIDNYNYGRFLAGAINSALNQSYSHIEVIVVDDGSTDDSRSVLARYEGRVKIVLKGNGGQASAFNAGIGAAVGDLVALLDADDLWLPHKLAATVAAARAHPGAVLLYHRVLPVDAAGRTVGRPRPGRLERGTIRKQMLRSPGCWSFAPTSAMTFRRSALERMLPLPESAFRICADSYLADVAPFLGPVYGIEPALTLLRLHGQNHWNADPRLRKTEEAMRRGAQLYETRVREQNAALARLRLADRVSLDDHYPYWRLRYLLGEAPSIRPVLRAGLRLGSPAFMARRAAALLLMAAGRRWGRR